MDLLDHRVRRGSHGTRVETGVTGNVATTTGDINGIFLYDMTPASRAGFS